MANNSEIPDGWAMSDELAKKVSEVLNKKPVSPGDELVDALDELARDIALIEPDPKDWGWYVTYLLEKMEEEAQRRGSQAEFIRMLESLKMDIDN